MEDLFHGNEYANEKLRKALGILREQYFKSSVIEKIVTVKDATDEKAFSRLGFRHLIPKEWFTSKTHYIDLVFEQLADNLAHSEYKIIVDRIFKSRDFPEIDIAENTPKELVEKSKEFSKNNKIDALFAPINFYVDMYTEWYKEVPDFKVDFGSGAIFLVEAKQDIFWSNKYIPFNDFAFIDKRFLEMTFKPNFKDRLYVNISQSEKIDMIDLSFSITFNDVIADSSKILILHAKKTDE